MTSLRAPLAALLFVGAACAAPSVEDDPKAPSLPPECETSSDCPHDVSCVDGFCFSEGLRCGLEGGDCGVLYECSDTFCGGIEDGHCVVPEGGECCSIFDCDFTEACLDFRCVAGFCRDGNDCDFVYGLTDDVCAVNEDCPNGTCIAFSPPVCTDFRGTCCEDGDGTDGCFILPALSPDGGAGVTCSFSGDCVDGQCVWARPPPPGGRRL